MLRLHFGGGQLLTSSRQAFAGSGVGVGVKVLETRKPYDTRKAAFTLAEVLIVLGVVGVVAALTIPNLMAKYQEKQFVTSWKRVYSLLNQAYKMAELEYGGYEGWTKTSEVLHNNFLPYLKIILDCNPNSNKKICNQYRPIKVLSHEVCKGTANCIGYQILANSTHKHYYVQLMSGEYLYFTKESHGVEFTVDLNGPAGPNTMGKDVHIYTMRAKTLPNNTTVYTVEPGVSWALTYSYCDKNNSTVWTPGSDCGVWIKKHGNMDYLHMTSDEIRAKW